MDQDPVSEAIVVWTGMGESAWPHRDDERMVKRFGQDAAIEMAQIVHLLSDEFYECDARWTVGDLHEMGRVASQGFRHLHPEISEAAVETLAWCYTFDFK